jgi:putative spermidine/putrescine transport system permease protein
MNAKPAVSLGERVLIHGGSALYYSFAILVLVLLVLPIIVIIPMSFTSTSFLIFPPQGFSLRWYEAYFSRYDWVGPTILSVQVAASVAILSTLIATPAAFALVRGQFWEKRLMHVVVLLPMIIPVIISAIAIYFALARMNLVGTAIGLILAHTVLALPREVLVISAVARGFNRQLEMAARSLGASPWKTLRYVTLPMLSYGILAGAVVAFVTSFDEVIVAIFISGASAVTLPRRMWDSVQVGYDPIMVAASSLLITFAVVMVGMGMLLRRRAEPSANLRL